MSELYNDPRWNHEAREVAEKLDRNDVYGAQESMRRDLWQLQSDPYAQHDFINMVNRFDQKGLGADINVYPGPNGQEQWQISPPNYGGGQYYPAPLPPPETVIPVQPSPGDALVNGLATGAGLGIGMGIMQNIFRGDRR